MSYLPELRDALRLAAARQAGASIRSRRGHRWRLRLSRVALVLAVLASVVLGGFFIAKLHRAGDAGGTAGGNSSGPHSVPRAWSQANNDAMRKVFFNGRDRVCNPSLAGKPQRPLKLIQTAPGVDFTSVLGVLHHPAPDREGVSARQLNHLLFGDAVQGVYIRYVRHGVADGVSYYMIPAQRVGEIPRPAQCYAQLIVAFKREIDRLPAAQRVQALAWERHQIRQQHGPRPGIALITRGGGSTGAAYIPLTRLHQPDGFRNGSGGSNGITKTALVLPNPVATVTAHYPPQTYPGRVRHPITITKRVVNNLVIFVFRGAWDPPKLTFRSSTGRVISRTP